ncbi:PHP domain-containing protein [Glaciecola petra]|uniref:PHP domain-containing protein n=1 Tax=Glaciecola petra TaxID=3075602 RepID=A0ABU2ZNF2_9ALTE|nr:PHP domain-containing protein [Aestuariibacter sp. P117]MDT0593573.1 PHP domain-containing protein [Aestuariibacter sp. P117]
MAFLLVLLALIIDFSPLIAEKPVLDGNQAQQARGQAKQLIDGLASSADTIDLRFAESDILAISATMSHMFDNTNFGLGYSPQNITIASSSSFGLGLFNIYLNLSCQIGIDFRASHIKTCHIGDLPLPGFLVDGILYSSLYLVFDGEVADTIDNLITSAQIENRAIVIDASKSIDFRKRVNDTLSDARSVAKLAIQNNIPDPSIIQIYLDDLARQGDNENLFWYIRNSMQLASLRSIDNPAVIENQAALWAWAISFAGDRFASLAGIDKYETNRKVKLRDRRDLALHFLFSAIIAQISNNEFSANVGELKEILDSGKGGSGFSFADLVADNTGIAFSRTLTENTRSALAAQQLLANMYDERSLIPHVHDLPEGLSDSEFKILFSSAQSETFKDYVASVDARIKQLPLYTNAAIDNSNKPMSLIDEFPYGKWLTIDTHIHSTYSDGEYSIANIAAKSKQFGCDAIAITDHGDSPYTGVFSSKYFDDIKKANVDNTNLTVIPGLEWNIPPFNGREHATVLLPRTANTENNYADFKSKYDHFNDFSKMLISQKPAFDWLNSLARSAPVAPVVFYNHPSRKDLQVSENSFDFLNWQSMSSTLIGMSAAPGHQRLSGEDRGAYIQRLRTLHGMDPTARVGGEWDKLLQQGLRVLSARAPSDFHNLNMDYWPCEYSSTHVYAKSNTHNDILEALTNGKTWAQLGQFVEYLDFGILSRNKKYSSGQVLAVRQSQEIEIRILMRLKELDWDGFSTRLDELNLVVVSANNVESINLLPNAKLNGKKIELTMNMNIGPDIKAIRLVGRSIQPGLHHYKVFTNPIFVTNNVME